MLPHLCNLSNYPKMSACSRNATSWLTPKHCRSTLWCPLEQHRKYVSTFPREWISPEQPAWRTASDVNPQPLSDSNLYDTMSRCQLWTVCVRLMCVRRPAVRSLSHNVIVAPDVNSAWDSRVKLCAVLVSPWQFWRTRVYIWAPGGEL